MIDCDCCCGYYSVDSGEIDFLCLLIYCCNDQCFYICGVILIESDLCYVWEANFVALYLMVCINVMMIVV